MSKPLTYINTTCRVGQRIPCGEPATHVIAVVTVTDTAWSDEPRDGGIVGLCDYHANTPAAEWESVPSGAEGATA